MAQFKPQKSLTFADEAPSLEDQVKAAIAECAAGNLSNGPVPAPRESIWEFFHRGEIQFKSPEGHSLTPVLVFDQFEAAFLSVESRPAKVNSLLNELVFLAQNSVPPDLAIQLDQDSELAMHLDFDGVPLYLVLAIRSDFLFALSRQPLAQCGRTLVNIELMKLTGVQALKVVHQVAPQLVDTATSETVVRMAAGVSSDTPLEATIVDPPLLSVLCDEINAGRKAAGRAKIDEDLLHGVRTGEILEDFYESCFESVPAPVRQFVEERLVSPFGSRDTVLVESALAELGEDGVSDPDRFIRGLVDRRLLQVFASGAIARIELTNDILARIAQRRRDERRAREERREAERNAFEKLRKAQRGRRLAGAAAILLALLSIGALGSAYVAFWPKVKIAG